MSEHNGPFLVVCHGCNFARGYEDRETALNAKRSHARGDFHNHRQTVREVDELFRVGCSKCKEKQFETSLSDAEEIKETEHRQCRNAVRITQIGWEGGDD